MDDPKLEQDLRGDNESKLEQDLIRENDFPNNKYLDHLLNPSEFVRFVENAENWKVGSYFDFPLVYSHYDYVISDVKASRNIYCLLNLIFYGDKSNIFGFPAIFENKKTVGTVMTMLKRNIDEGVRRVNVQVIGFEKNTEKLAANIFFRDCFRKFINGTTYENAADLAMLNSLLCCTVTTTTFQNFTKQFIEQYLKLRVNDANRNILIKISFPEKGKGRWELEDKGELKDSHNTVKAQYTFVYFVNMNNKFKDSNQAVYGISTLRIVPAKSSPSAPNNLSNLMPSSEEPHPQTDNQTLMSGFKTKLTPQRVIPAAVLTATALTLPIVLTALLGGGHKRKTRRRIARKFGGRKTRATKKRKKTRKNTRKRQTK